MRAGDAGALSCACKYTMAEALYAGSLGKNAHSDAMRLNPEVLDLARKVEYAVDPAFPGPGRFKGAVRDAEGRACSRRLKSTTAARRRTR